MFHHNDMIPLTGIDEVADDAVNGVNHKVDIDGSSHAVVTQSLANARSDLLGWVR